MLDACGPCLILMDEMVAYVRKIYGVFDLPSGSYDSVMSFMQELTEAVRASKNSLLVASIPESDIEAGGDISKKALESTSNTSLAGWRRSGSRSARKKALPSFGNACSCGCGTRRRWRRSAAPSASCMFKAHPIFRPGAVN